MITLVMATNHLLRYNELTDTVEELSKVRPWNGVSSWHRKRLVTKQDLESVGSSVEAFARAWMESHGITE